MNNWGHQRAKRHRKHSHCSSLAAPHRDLQGAVVKQANMQTASSQIFLNMFPPSNKIHESLLMDPFFPPPPFQGPWEPCYWSFQHAKCVEIDLERKHLRCVFCFHPPLIELQRAGSVCVMKFALVICFHTLWPAACPRAAPSPRCRGLDTQLEHTQHAADIHAADRSVCLCGCYQARHTSRSIFSHKARV